ncbi:MAG: MATE family efflux transporter [Eubacteriales bacterium]|nr:MATE family efflux transporter [Eubacteriales bacterium]
MSRNIPVQSHDTALFGSAPIPVAVMTLAVPTIITQLINIVYNFADTWYVGRTGSAAMVAALAVCMPVFILMSAIANLFGIGGASVISRALGRKEPLYARHAFSFCLYTGLAVSVLFGLFILLLRGRLIPVIGGDDQSYAFIYDYMFWTMVVGAVPTVGNVLCGHLVRSVGAAKEAGFGMSMGGVLNIILDPLFMFVILPPGREVTGAAIATCLSNTAAFAYFLLYLRRHRSHPVLTLSIRDFSARDRIPVNVISIGVPAALATTMAMLSNITANSLVSEYGSAAVAGMGVAKKINMLAFNTTMGLTQGVLPLLGYNFGAGNLRRMKKAIFFTGITGLCFNLLCTIVFRSFAPELVRFFIAESASVDFGSSFLRVIALATPLASLSYLTNTVFQASGRRISSFLLSVLRKGCMDIPLMFLFKSMMGMYGIVWATPTAETGSLAVAGVLILLMLRDLRKDNAFHRQ